MRKKVLKQFFALMSSLCMIMCLMPTAVNANDTDIVKYVALGDSITSGYGLTDPENQAFPALIAKEQNYSVVNRGQAGLTSEGLLTLLADQDVAGDVASADIISITIGGNDLMNALYAYLAEQFGNGMTADYVKDQFETNNTVFLAQAISHLDSFGESEIAAKALTTFGIKLYSIIAAIKKANPDVLIFVSTQYNPYQWLPDQCTNLLYKDYAQKITAAFNDGVSALNTMINSTAFQSNGAFTVVDVYGAFANSYVNLSNAQFNDTMGIPTYNLDFHPNTAGHQVIADTMITAMNASIKKVLENAEASLTALGTLTADQKDVSSQETAQAWVANQVKTLSIAGVNLSATVDQFVLPVAGTASQPTGTNGSFSMRVTLQYAGQSKTVDVPVTIKATAYSAPVVDDNKTEEENKQPQETHKTEKVESVNTGDSTNIMGYTAMMLTSMVLLMKTIRKKQSLD